MQSNVSLENNLGQTLHAAAHPFCRRLGSVKAVLVHLLFNNKASHKGALGLGTLDELDLLFWLLMNDKPSAYNRQESLTVSAPNLRGTGQTLLPSHSKAHTVAH